MWHAGLTAADAGQRTTDKYQENREDLSRNWYVVNIDLFELGTVAKILVAVIDYCCPILRFKYMKLSRSCGNIIILRTFFDGKMANFLR